MDTRVSREPTPNGVFAVLLTACVAIAFAFRFYGLADYPFRYDEMFSVTIADATVPIGTMVEQIRHDVHPPFYYLLLRLWMDYFGSEEAAVRSLSASFGFAAVLVAATYYRRLTDGWTHVVYVALLSISLGATWYSQEARSYSLLLFLSTILTGVTLSIVRTGRAEGRIRASSLLLLLVASIIAAYVHHFGTIVAAACYLTILLSLWGRRTLIRLVVLAGLVFAMSFAAWLLLQIPNIDHLTGGRFWIENDVALLVRHVLVLLFGKKLGVFGVAAVLLIYLFARLGGAEPMSADIRAPIMIILFCIGIPAVISFHTPIMTPRNLIIIVPAAYLVLAHVLTWVTVAPGADGGWRQFRIAAVGLLVGVMMMPSLESKTAPATHEWREAGEFILDQPGCGRASILVNDARDLTYYDFYTNHARPGIAVSFVQAPSSGRLAAATADRLAGDGCPVVWWEAERSGPRPSLSQLFPDRDPAEFQVERFIGSTVHLDRR